MYLLKLALRPWRLAPLSQVFSAAAVGFLLLIAGFMFWMERGLRPVIGRLQSEQVITAYLDPTVSAKDEAGMVDSIRIAVGSQAFAPDPDVKLVGPQQFVESLKDHYPELSKELDDLGGEANQVIPRYISVSGLLPGAALEHVKAVAGVESAESSKDRHQHIVGAFRALRWVARLFVAGLCLALVTGLIHLARMNGVLQSESLSLLRLWGASAWTLRVPGLLAGLGAGLAGGMVALVGWFSGGAWLAQQIRHLSPMLRDMSLPTFTVGFALLAAGAVLGLVSGAFGGIPSSQRGDGRG